MATTAMPGGAGSSSAPITVTSAHLTLVSMVVLVGMIVVFIEVAGTGRSASTVVMMLLVGIVLLLGVQQAGRFTSFASSYPFNPGSGAPAAA